MSTLHVKARLMDKKQKAKTTKKHGEGEMHGRQLESEDPVALGSEVGLGSEDEELIASDNERRDLGGGGRRAGQPAPG